MAFTVDLAGRGGRTSPRLAVPNLCRPAPADSVQRTVLLGSNARWGEQGPQRFRLQPCVARLVVEGCHGRGQRQRRSASEAHSLELAEPEAVTAGCVGDREAVALTGEEVVRDQAAEDNVSSPPSAKAPMPPVKTTVSSKSLPAKPRSWPAQ